MVDRCQLACQKGMALIAVLWITAALSLLAMSLSQMARTDIRVVTVFKQSILAQSLADGALNVAADWLQGQLSSITGMKEIDVNVGQQTVAVHIVPSTGFININMAPPELLRDLFIYGAGLSTDQAEALTKNVIDWRSPPAMQGKVEAENAPRHAPFMTPQDIRQVGGITPDIYARIAPLIVANPQAVMNSLVDPNAAPAGVLLVLAQGKQAVVQKILAERAEQGKQNTSVQTNGLNSAFLQTSGSPYFRLTATVRGTDNILWQRTWWIDYSMQMQSTTPWRVAQVNPLISTGISAGTHSGGRVDRE